MRRIFALLAIALVGLLVHPHPSSAQDGLVNGTWSGTMTQPKDGEVLAIEYHVTHHDGKLAIAIATPMGRFPFSDISLSGGVLRFTWQPGPLIDCQLEPQRDGGYLGDCVDQSGATGQLLMVPPAPVQ